MDIERTGSVNWKLGTWEPGQWRRSWFKPIQLISEGTKWPGTDPLYLGPRKKWSSLPASCTPEGSSVHDQDSGACSPTGEESIPNPSSDAVKNTELFLCIFPSDYIIARQQRIQKLRNQPETRREREFLEPRKKDESEWEIIQTKRGATKESRQEQEQNRANQGGKAEWMQLRLFLTPEWRCESPIKRTLN
jgi:hypothetical protein